MNSADGTIHLNSSFSAKTLFIYVFAWANGFVNPQLLKQLAVYKIKEDFCQALGIMSTSKYQNDGGPEILKIWLFNYVMGNCDSHGK